ncbi:unnamed protein product, partial [Allacma fusca]
DMFKRIAKYLTPLTRMRAAPKEGKYFMQST